MKELESKLTDIIYDAIDDIVKVRDGIDIVKDPQTVLYGSSSSLDSLALVALIVAVEEKIDDEFDKTVTLANEKAMSLKNSPFRTIQTLAAYAATLVNEDHE